MTLVAIDRLPSYRYSKPLRITGANLVFGKEFAEKADIATNRFLNIYADIDKKIIALKFLRKESDATRKIVMPREKTKAYAHINIVSLMKKLGIPLGTRSALSYKKQKDMFILSYRDLVEK